VLAAAGAIVILLGFVGTAAEAGGAAAILIAALVTAGSKDAPGSSLNWWKVLAAGALFAVVGVPLSLGLETIGGLIAGTGAALALVAVPFGWR
jgi:hypothetical protein